MPTNLKRILILSLVFGSLISFALQSDQVSPRSWIRSSLGSMAAKGLLNIPSRLLFSDGVYSRGEIAILLKDLINKAEDEPWDFSDEDFFILGKLIDEFSQELEALNVNIKDVKEKLELSYYQNIFIGGRFAGIAHYDSDNDESDSKLLYRVSSFIPLSHGFTYFSASNERRWLAKKPSDFSLLDSAIAKIPFWDADWEVGRGYVRLGPGYVSSVWLSDNPPPYDYLLFSKNFKIGSWGFFHFKQFHTTYSSNGIRRYYIARRIEKTLKDWDFALYDIHFSDQFPSLFAFVPILPLYAVQYFWENDYNVNVIMGLEVAKNFPNGAIYGDWFVDDITTYPHHVPRKTALLLGGRKKCKDFTFHIEYFYADNETYTHKNPNDDYLYKGYPMGFPLGRDSRGIFTRIDFHKNPPFIFQIARTTQLKSSPSPIKTTEFSLLLPYDMGTDKSLTLGIRHQKVTSGGKEENNLIGELRVEYNF